MLKEIGEFGLIEKIKASFEDGNQCRGPIEGITGIGDDCAVIPQKSGLDTVISTDMLIEGTHFILSDITPFQLGWKAAAVNISDIAAMGAQPIATLLSIALPVRIDKQWVFDFIEGYKSISDKYGLMLLGGDTTASPDRICINVAVMGSIKHGRAKLRSNAVAGDLVCVTGPLGDSAAGLEIILNRNQQYCRTAISLKGTKPIDSNSISANGNSISANGISAKGISANCNSISAKGNENRATAEYCTDKSDAKGYENLKDEIAETLIKKHYLPEPRVAEGIWLSSCSGVHAMMDISDGVASDLRHILKASGVSAEIDTSAIPISDELREFTKCVYGSDFSENSAIKLALSGGEDYELLFTISEEEEKTLKARHYIIGRIIQGEDNRIIWKGTNYEFEGFKHF